MIASLRGPVLHVGLDHLVVETGGVGLLVHTTPAAAAECRTGQEARLQTTLVVREESLTLYGFHHRAERELFEQVQTVSGVGPRLALALLSVHSPDEVRRALTEADLAALTRVPGIGRKSAERLVLELRDKVAAPSGATPAVDVAPGSGAGAAGDQVLEALTGLGWSAKQAEAALATVTAGPDAPQEVSELLRTALRELGR